MLKVQDVNFSLRGLGSLGGGKRGRDFTSLLND